MELNLHLSGTILKRWGDPALSIKCVPITDADDLSFFNTMSKVCRDYNGAGLAAPQIGVLKRAVLIMPTGAGRNYKMLNPVIVETSKETDVSGEGCLSYPGIIAQVKRHVWIVCEYLDWQRRPARQRMTGWEARIVQHELDHLDGKCEVGDAWEREQKLFGRLGIAQ